MGWETPDPYWTDLLVTSAEDDAWQELQDRQDRAAEKAPASRWDPPAGNAGGPRSHNPSEEK